MERLHVKIFVTGSSLPRMCRTHASSGNSPYDNRSRNEKQVRLACERRHYSPRTATSYVYWTRRYVLFHGKRHPRELGRAELEAYLNHLARNRRVAASTQAQALNALIFLYLRASATCVSQYAHFRRDCTRYFDHSAASMKQDYDNALGRRGNVEPHH